MYKIPQMKQFLSLATGLLLLSAIQLALAGDLQEESRFDIAPQELDSALLEFSEQADIQLVVAANSLDGIETLGISGKISGQSALNTLLKDTGLRFNVVGSTITVTNGHVDEANATGKAQPASNKNLIAQTETSARQNQMTVKAATNSGAEKTEVEGNTIEEVIITATKTGETKLQETPMSITAISDELLHNTHSQKMSDLTQHVPNVQFQSYGPYFSAYIRGIGTTNLSLGGESNAGFYLDGVYLERGNGANINFFDVERIEVLRGPQGTLYGRNTTSGAVNIITKRPSNELELKAGIIIGDYNNRRLNATMSGPIVRDKVKARLTVSDNKHDGYVDNKVGPDLFNENNTGLRGTVDFTLTDNVDILLSADYFKADERGNADRLMTARGLIGAIAARDGIPATQLVTDDFWETYQNKDEQLNVELWGVSVTAEFQLTQNQILRSVTGYRKYKQYTLTDADASTAEVLWLELKHSSSTFTQELQFNGSWNRLKWLGGLYYIHSSTPFPQVAVHFDFIIPGYTLTRVVELETDAWAGFGTVYYDINDKLSVEAGVRYSYEEKELPDGYRDSTNMPGPFPPTTFIEWDDNWDDVTWKGGVNYRPTNEALLFATVSTGFKSGTVNTGNPLASLTVDPEYLTSYEIGIKSDWFGNRLRANGTVFYYDYTDLQVNVLIPPASIIRNAAKATVKGAELELLAMPILPLTLNGSISYLDAEYGEFLNAVGENNTPTDASGNPLPYAPEWKLSFGAQYVIPVGDYGYLTFRGDLSWVDEQYFSPLKSSQNRQHAYTLVNGLVRFETMDGHWSFEIFGKNLGEEEYAVSGTFAFGDSICRVGAPRTFGFQAIYNF